MNTIERKEKIEANRGNWAEKIQKRIRQRNVSIPSKD
jgi:hypothetical protein